ncbi:MATE family efflux transporter [Candidiatus Paracoxiella cheracis]|uniref:MATE family efflux transporter n=1 Tax=Candidiatus Paracoxiella cheracis TaxID=3405120 RepID=UPI003BF52C66
MFLILFFRTNVVYNVKFFFGFYVKQFLIIFINLSKVQFDASAPKPTHLVGKTIRLALPMAGSRLIQMLSGFIGMLMLARLGHTVLAASALMTPTMITIIVIMIALLFSVSVVVGQAWGAGKQYEIGSIIQQGCVLALIISIPAMILFWYVDRFLLWTGQPPELIVYVRQYFHALEWGVVPIMLGATIQQACYGMLKQRLVIILNSFCLLIFVGVSYILIFGKLGFKDYGVAGLSYAFSIQAWLNLILLLVIFYVLPELKPMQLFAKRDGSASFLLM